MIFDCEQFAGPCACGKTHEAVTGRIVIEAGCLGKFAEYAAAAGLAGRAAAVYDGNTRRAAGLIPPPAAQEIVLSPDNLHADEKSTAEILRSVAPGTDYLIAVGSGTIHDCTRYCAAKLGIPFVSCPTAASVDGFSSPMCAMTWNGCKTTLPGVPPVLVLADLDVIRQAPRALALSGVGDVLGKYTALADWKIGHLLTGEYFCQRLESLTRRAVQEARGSCGLLAQNSPEAYEKLTFALVLSGLAMQFCGNSRPASGAEHHISHFLEMNPCVPPVSSSALHGEKVGVGTLAVSRLYHRLARTENIAPFVKPYEPVDAELVRRVFGPTADAVLAENKGDCLAAVSPEKVIESWPAIRKIAEEIPSEEELLPLYREIGAKSSPEEIGVESAAMEQILRYSPYVRNRLTLMRLRRMLAL